MKAASNDLHAQGGTARRVRIVVLGVASLAVVLGAAYGLGAFEGSTAGMAELYRPAFEEAPPPLAIDEARDARVSGRAIVGASLEGDVLSLEVDEGGTLALHREADRLRMDDESALTLHVAMPMRVQLIRGAVELEGTFAVEGPSCRCRLAGRARVVVEENESPDGAWSSTHVTVIAGSVESMPSSACVMTPIAESLP